MQPTDSVISLKPSSPLKRYLNRLCRAVLSVFVVILCNFAFPFFSALSESRQSSHKPSEVEVTGTKHISDEQLIGAIYSLSGWGQQGGEKELAGLTFALDQINQRGGLLGKKLKLQVEDNASDLKTTLSATQRLTKIHNVPVIFGPNYAEFSEVVAPIAQREQTLMISSSGYTKTLTLNRPYVFTTLPAHKFLTAPLSDYIKSLNVRSIAIFKTNSAYLDSIAESFSEQLKPIDLRVFNFNPGETDYRSALLKAKNSGVGGILISIIQGDISAFLRQLRALKIDVPLFSSNSILFDDGVKQEHDLANGLILYDYSVAIPSALEVEFATKYGYAPKDNVARTYAAFEAWSQAVERCGSFMPTIIRKCLSQGTFKTVIGTIEFDDRNNVKPPGQVVNLLRFVNGSLAPL